MNNKQFNDLVGDFVGVVTRKIERQGKLAVELEAMIVVLVSSIESLVKKTKVRAEKLAAQKKREGWKQYTRAEYWQGRIDEMNWFVERIEEILAIGIVSANNPNMTEPTDLATAALGKVGKPAVVLYDAEKDVDSEDVPIGVRDSVAAELTKAELAPDPGPRRHPETPYKPRPLISNPSMVNKVEKGEDDD